MPLLSSGQIMGQKFYNVFFLPPNFQETLLLLLLLSPLNICADRCFKQRHTQACGYLFSLIWFPTVESQMSNHLYSKSWASPSQWSITEELHETDPWKPLEWQEESGAKYEFVHFRTWCRKRTSPLGQKYKRQCNERVCIVVSARLILKAYV